MTFDSGSVAFGYTDGYRDRAHAWHPWLSDRAEAEWREYNADHYYRWRHNRDHDIGWHEEHWWEHH